MSPERFRKLKAVLDRRQPDLTVVMEDVHKTHNLAAIARTCDAVGVASVHAIATDPKVRLSQKTASGSHRWVHFTRHASVTDCYADLRARGFRILATHLDEAAQDFRQVDFTRPTAIVVGAELDGVTESTAAAADGTVYIPMKGLVQSLNVSVATAVILYEAQRQREDAGLYDESRLDAETYTRTLFEWCHPEVAEYCRRKDLPYPALDEDGQLAEKLADRE